MVILKSKQVYGKESGSVSDVVMLLVELQRTWSYLEPLFIASDEVKKSCQKMPNAFKKLTSR